MDEIKFNNAVFEQMFKEMGNRIDNSNAIDAFVNELGNEINIDKASMFSLIKIGYTCALIDADTLISSINADEQNNK